jgi:TRAP-type C4-dicarboxylate transport system substrate-binding protein
MNLSPVVLPLSDVLLGLQTGLLDIIVTPAQAALLLQWYTKVNYINPLPVSYTLGILALDDRAFERLSPEDQMVVTEAMTETYQNLEEINRRDNIAAGDALLANGLKEVAASTDDIPYWYSIADETNAKMWQESAVDKELLGELMTELEKFRANGGSADAIAKAE